MFEHKRQKLLPRRLFLRRVAACFCVASLLVAVALMIGVLGYHYICGLSWVDAVLNASMILTGMGPVNPMETHRAKLFASAYALFSGVIFLSCTGVVLAPVFHRMMHRFHLNEAGDADNRD